MAPYSGDERRLAHRYPLGTVVEYRVLDSQEEDRVALGWGLDISETGISFQPVERLNEGLEIQLSIPWPWSPKTTNLQLIVVGRIVRSEEDRCAMQIRCYHFHVGALSDDDALKNA